MVEGISVGDVTTRLTERLVELMKRSIVSLGCMMAMAASMLLLAHPAYAGEGIPVAGALPFTNDNPIFMYVGAAGAVVIVMAIIAWFVQRKHK